MATYKELCERLTAIKGDLLFDCDDLNDYTRSEEANAHGLLATTLIEQARQHLRLAMLINKKDT